ncbi:MAG TPA: SDR family oxidoreductase [Candidatus Limnocylindrales bacterium]|nr:SDR family oxidoreductase [Candidatus Limnocylindrales bacterium]
MNLGIRGRSAIVCASSKGLGKACATALAREGVSVTINSRNAEHLAAAAEEIRRETGAVVTEVVGDIAAESTRKALLEACPSPDILVTNNGGPMPGRYQDWDRDAWIAALDANMLAPVLMIGAVVDGMVERGFGRIVNILSAMVKSPLAPMGLSAGARTGLMSFCKGVSREVAPFNVTINNLLPERIDTERQRFMAELAAGMRGQTIEQAYDDIRGSIAARRLGTPAEFGDACAYLCSSQAGFLSGQNLSLDGGTYAGIL